MVEAIAWALLAASSLLIGAEVAFRLEPSDQFVGLLMAFGIGALMSSVAFELIEPSLESETGMMALAGTAIAGAAVFVTGDWAIDRLDGSSGASIALGTALDGVPETALLGMTVASGEPSLALLAGVWLSNFPEAIGASRSMCDSDRTRRWIRGLWLGIVAAATAGAVAGFLIASGQNETIQTLMRAFGAGALLAMIVNALAPTAYRKGAYMAGLVTVVGFLVTTALGR